MKLSVKVKHWLSFSFQIFGLSIFLHMHNSPKPLKFKSEAITHQLLGTFLCHRVTVFLAHIFLDTAKPPETHKAVPFFRFSCFYSHSYFHYYLLTYSMDQSLSWEANQFSASQENSPHFMESEGSSLHLQVPANYPCPQPAQSSPCPHIPLPDDPS